MGKIPHNRGERTSGGIDRIDQRLDVGRPLRCNDPMFGQMPTQRIDELSALAD